jgi:triosephosphate isomerase (TIM)
MSRHFLIAGNWKMNGSLASNRELLQGVLAGAAQLPVTVKMAVCPPALYVAQAQGLLAGSAVALGAQDCSAQASGAYTGELSARMLLEMGCRYVIVGHSERRQYHFEGDIAVANKAKAALEAGLTPIVCVGETLEQREKGNTQAIIEQQINAVVSVLKANAAMIVVAYEPVWAIGTGKTATPAQAQEVHAFIRQLLRAELNEKAASVQILYGGSMKPDNARELLAQTDIDGGLIGGASLKVADFLAIAQAATLG